MGVEYQTPAYATKPLRTPLSAEIVQVWLTRVCSRFSTGHQEVSKCQTFCLLFVGDLVANLASESDQIDLI